VSSADALSRRSKHPVSLSGVEETLLIPLYARASESREREPLLRDPWAVTIVRRLAYDFSGFRRSIGLRWLALRSAIMDDVVSRFLAKYPFCTVIEIGAGLNARFERLDNGRVRWFDLDLPDVIALRQSFFLETSRRTSIAASVLDSAWPLIVRAGGRAPFLMVAEGVLPYLAGDQVKSAFGLALEHFGHAGCAFDTVPTRVCQRDRRRGVAPGIRARLAWTCDDPRELEMEFPASRLLESWSPVMLPPGFERRVPGDVRTTLAALRVLDGDVGDAFRVNLLWLANASGRTRWRLARTV
jgi:O-methyltransferase involved in polyketide biosynthesis